LLPASPAHGLASIPAGARKRMSIEHPSGASPVLLEMDADGNGVKEAAIVSTARRLFAGEVYVPA
jgi:4-oxalomesaconate tautomerase